MNILLFMHDIMVSYSLILLSYLDYVDFDIINVMESIIHTILFMQNYCNNLFIYTFKLSGWHDNIIQF
jgi:hypothetical protein